MEIKNCPDPRNCSKIHYFGKCPYNHQPCNRGTACPYVNQNNCQFYHPEEDYPQYKAKKAAKAKTEKRRSVITHLKIVTKPSATRLASMASKAFAEMAALKKYTPKAQLDSFSKPSVLSRSNNVAQSQVKIVQSKPLQQVAPAPMQKTNVREVRRYIPKTSVSNQVAASDVPKAILNEHKIPSYVTKIKEQEVYIRDLEGRIRATERTVEFNRGRAAEMESSKQKFFTCWSRAVKTLETIQESGALLDESIDRVINVHSASLRRHENSSNCAPDLFDQNANIQRQRYLQPKQVEDHPVSRQDMDIFLPQRVDSKSSAYDQSSMFFHEPGSGFADHDQVNSRNRNEDNNLMHFVVEDMLSCLEL